MTTIQERAREAHIAKQQKEQAWEEQQRRTKIENAITSTVIAAKDYLGVDLIPAAVRVVESDERYHLDATFTVDGLYFLSSMHDGRRRVRLLRRCEDDGCRRQDDLIYSEPILNIETLGLILTEPPYHVEDCTAPEQDPGFPATDTAQLIHKMTPGEKIISVIVDVVNESLSQRGL